MIITTNVQTTSICIRNNYMYSQLKFNGLQNVHSCMYIIFFIVYKVQLLDFYVKLLCNICIVYSMQTYNIYRKTMHGSQQHWQYCKALHLCKRFERHSLDTKILVRKHFGTLEHDKVLKNEGFTVSFQFAYKVLHLLQERNMPLTCP